VRRTGARDTSQRKGSPGDKCGGQVPGIPARGWTAQGGKCGGQVLGIPVRGRAAQWTSAEDRCQGYKPENGQPRGQVRRTSARDTSQREASPGDKCGGQVPGIPARGRPAQGISAEDRCQGYQPEEGQPRG
jgi:hypothetical protein